MNGKKLKKELRYADKGRGLLPNTYKWEEQKELGKGSFGTVVLGYDKKSRKYMAVKKIPTSASRDAIKEVMKEVDLLSTLKHENIVNFQGYQ